MPGIRSARRPRCSPTADRRREGPRRVSLGSRGGRKAVAALRSRKHRERQALRGHGPDLGQARGVGGDRRGLRNGILAAHGGRSSSCPRRSSSRSRQAPSPRETAHRSHASVHTAPPSDLTVRLEKPFVLTSGNVSDEPIATRRRRLQRLAPSPMSFSPTTGRSTSAPTTRWCARDRARDTAVRRARGYAPQPILLAVALSAPHPRVRRRVEEHLLPGARAPRLSITACRRPREFRDPARLHRWYRPLQPDLRHRPRRCRATTCIPNTCPPSMRSRWKASSASPSNTTTRMSLPVSPTTVLKGR